jgi:hypothetical protein
MQLSGRLSARRKWALLFIAIGIVLVFNPVYLDPFGIGAEQYEYRTAQVTPSENYLQYHSGVPEEVNRLNDVDCYFDVTQPIECEIQGVLADGQNRSAVVRDTSRWDLQSYIHVNGTFYRRYYWSDPLGPVNESVPDEEEASNIDQSQTGRLLPMDHALSVWSNAMSLARNLPPVVVIRGLASNAMAAVKLIPPIEADTNFVR